MTRVAASVDNRALLVQDAFAHKDQLKLIPGARWVARQQAWALPRSPLAARDILRALAGAPHEDQVGLPALASLADLARRQDPELEEPLPNYSTLYTPWKHQTRAGRWLAGREAALLQYGMRTGKTRSTLDGLRHTGAPVALVVSPLNACRVWEKEAADHHPNHFKVLRLDKVATPKRVATLEREAALARATRRQLLVLINYEATWRKPLDEALLKLRLDVLIFDEIHRLKSAGSQQSKYASRLMTKAARRWGLSGTPLSQSLIDAYGVWRSLDKGVFGTSLAEFERRYCVMGGFGGYEIIRYQNEDEFRERFFALTLTATRDVLDLPPAMHETVWVKIPDAALKLHDELEEEAVAELEGGTMEVIATNVLTRLLRMSQIASGHVKVEPGLFAPAGTEPHVKEIHTAKEDALVGLIEDLDPLEPVVVFCRFTHDLHQVERAAARLGRGYHELSGNRKDLEPWLQSRGGEILGVQYQSGSESIDLARAAYMVLYDDVFSLAQSEQAITRIHGPKSRKSVMYFHLVARGTVDTYVRNTLTQRRDVLDRLLDERKLIINREAGND